MYNKWHLDCKLLKLKHLKSQALINWNKL